MKRITLPKILRSLETMEFKVEVDADIAARARVAIDRMIALPLKRQSMYDHRKKPEVFAIERRA
jgi:quinolinate synthase